MHGGADSIPSSASGRSGQLRLHRLSIYKAIVLQDSILFRGWSLGVKKAECVNSIDQNCSFFAPLTACLKALVFGDDWLLELLLDRGWRETPHIMIFQVLETLSLALSKRITLRPNHLELHEFLQTRIL